VKPLKFLLATAGALLGLAVIALIGLVMVVDGAFVKARLERAMQEKNRTLKIEGEPRLRLFPIAGLTVGKTTLSEPGGAKPFVTLERAEIAVRVLPLLSGEVAIEALNVTNLRANLVRRRDGSMNFSDLAGPTPKEGKKEPLPVLRIAGARVEGVQIAFHDEATGQEMTLAEMNLKAERLDGATPGDVGFSARITGKHPEIDLRAQASGALSFNLRNDEFAFDKFVAQLKGRIDQETIAAEFAAPKVEVTSSRASGSAIKGSLKMKGSQRNVDLSYTLSLAGPPLTADLTAKLDESTVKAKLELADLSPLKARFELSADKLDLDRYFPPERRDANPDRAIDLSVLKGKTVAGKASIGLLLYRHARLENVKAELKIANGRLEIQPYSATLYGGTLAGEMSVDSDGNKLHFKETAQNVAIGAMLRDMTRKDFVEGRGNLTMDVHSAGSTVAALKKALAGSARVDMKEGVIKGVDFANAMRKGAPAQRTEFSDLSASLKVTNGIARNDDLKAHSPLLNLAGAGNLDIGNNGIDYVARATLGRGVSVPVKVYGALDEPQWSVDYTSLAGGVVGGTAGAVTDTVKGSAGSVKDAVRGLFRR
jgi:AsmA protein